MNRVYLDYNATTPTRPQALAAMVEALHHTGNPSSVHHEGRLVRGIVENARAEIATLVHARAADVFFTSGATEALNLALTPHIQHGKEAQGFTHLLVSEGEHVAALRGHRFARNCVTVLPLDGSGLVKPEVLRAALALIDDNSRVMVCIQLANNETGVIQPIAELAAIVHERGGILVVDAAQALGKIPLDVKTLGADLLILSSHKCGGPMGAGALVRGNTALHMAEPALKGGGQERGWRGGTENVPAIAGFGVACAQARSHMMDEMARIVRLRQRVEDALKEHHPHTVIYSESAPRLPTTVAFSVPGLSAEAALMMLDLEGIAVSSGSACSSGKVKASHVLQAMGVPPKECEGMVRVSLGWSSTTRDVEEFLNAWGKICPRASMQPEKAC